MEAAPHSQHRVDVYDERNLQAKALERWNRQREVWDGMRTRLLTQTGKGNAAKGMADNFAYASTRNRERQEELGMLEAAIPLSALDSHYVWESMLRRGSDAGGVRYVQLGKAYFPYALFCEVKDPTSRKPDHASYTRVVAEDYLMDPLTTMGAQVGKRASRAARRSRLLGAGSGGSVGGGGAAGIRTSPDPRDADLDEMEAALRAMRGGGSGDSAADTYYEQQLRAYAPYIEKRLAHFAVPRQFLAVEGVAAPMHDAGADDWPTSPREDGGVTTGEGEDVEPIQYFPPPPQQQRVAIPCPSSRPSTASSASPSLGRAPGGRDAATATPPFDAVSVRLSSVGDALVAAAAFRNSAEEEGCGDEVAVAGGSDGGGGGGSGADAAPSLELSTQRLFLRADPGALAHAHLTIRNPSTVTVYYSWVGVDLVQEDIADLAEAAAEERQADEAGGTETAKESSPATSTEVFCQVQQSLHRMAKHAAASKDYFRLSRPANGVILPGEDELFPFSVRTPRAGRFKQRYELLTIPPSPTRVFVEVVALVRATSAGISATALARPVEAALNAGAVRDSQRHLVQQLVRGDLPWDTSDLLGAIDAIRQRKQAAHDREEARRGAQRRSWHRANAATYDGIPYNRAVYDKLERLWENAVHALDVLTGAPDAEEEAPTRPPPTTTEVVAADRPHLPIGPRRWNGGINALLAKVATVRDSPSRNLLYDAVMALLRVARAATLGTSASEAESDAGAEEGKGSARETEKVPLAVLLHRAADALASHVEARRAAAYEQEVDLLLLPLEPSVYATLSSSSSGATGPSGGGERKKRSPSASNGRKGAATVAGAGHPSASAINNNHHATSSALTAAASGVGQGEPLLLGSLRSHLRDSAAPQSAEEEEGRRRERAEMLSAFRRSLADDHAALAQTYWRELSEAIETGCDLSLVDVVQAHRLDDLRLIQTHEAMTVDAGVEVQPLKPTASGGGGGKKRGS